MENFKIVAKTLAGLEDLLAKEIETLGGSNIVVGTRMVAFEGNKEMLYKANLWLRTALRILKPVENFLAGDPDELYANIKTIDWTKYIAEGQTIAIDNTIYSDNFRNSRYAIYRAKDAICDWFVEHGMKRPKVAVTSADVLLNLHIADTADSSRSEVTISLDSSGEPLYKRGYKEQQTDAPISEVLAAGILLKAGWNGERDLFDPMCGSGTFLVEAALIATNTPAGIYRKGFGFQRWTTGDLAFDEDLWQNLYDDDSQEREFKFHIFGADISKVAIDATRQNVKSAGLSKYISLEVRDFEETTVAPVSEYASQLKAEGADVPSLMVVTNPPYGKRLFTDVPTFYHMMGSVLKKYFQGAEAWIISSENKIVVKDPKTGLKSEAEPFDFIGLKASLKTELNNGGIDCQLRKYELFNGKFDAFRAEGNSLDKKTADEKEERKFERQHRGSDRKEGGRKPFDRDRKPFDRDRKPFDRDRKDSEREKKPFDRERKPFRTKDSATERKYTVRQDGTVVTNDAEERSGEKEAFARNEKATGKGRKPFDRERKPFDRDRKDSEREKKPFDRERKPFDRDRNASDKDRKPFDRDRKPFDRDRNASDKDRKPFDREHKPFDKEGKPYRKREEGAPTPRKRREYDPNRPMFGPDFDINKVMLDYSKPAATPESGENKNQGSGPAEENQ